MLIIVYNTEWECYFKCDFCRGFWDKQARGVLDFLNFVQIHACLDCCSHSITMEVFTPTLYKIAKILQIEHTPGVSFT